MSSKKALILIFVGIAIMTVPFFIRVRDKKQAEHYIEEIEQMGEDKEDDKE